MVAATGSPLRKVQFPSGRSPSPIRFHHAAGHPLRRHYTPIRDPRIVEVQQRLGEHRIDVFYDVEEPTIPNSTLRARDLQQRKDDDGEIDMAIFHHPNRCMIL